MPQVKWPRTCVVCKTRYRRTNDGKRKFMTKFPLDEDRCREWVKAIGDKDLLYIPIEKLHQIKYVCGDHFEEKHFNVKGTRLNKFAIPSLKMSLNPLSNDQLMDFPINVSRDDSFTTDDIQASVLPMKTRTNQPEQIHCNGCLSTGRTCSPVGDRFNVLRMLLDTPKSNESPTKWTQLMFCWECQAMLNRIQRFKKQIQKVDMLLRLHSGFVMESQSCLKSIHKDSYDLIIDRNVDEDINTTVIMIKNEHSNREISDEKKKRNIANDIKNELVNCNDELFDDDNLNDFVNVNVNDHLNNYNVNVSDDVNKSKTKQGVKRNKCYTKYKVNQHKYKDYMMKRNIVAKESIFSDKMKRDEYEKFVCDVCRLDFDKSEDFQKHFSTKHHNELEGVKNKSTQIETVYKCNVCNYDFKEEVRFKQHFGDHREIYKCNECKLVFESSIAVNRHYKELHRHFRCDHCNRVYTSKARLARHMQVHEKQECNICKRDFTSRTKLGRHRLNAHGVYTRKVPPASKEAAYCVECDRQFVSLPALKKHLYSSVRHGAYRQKSVPCPDCGKVFARLGYMKNHHRLYHSDELRHQCDICGKRFVTAFTVRQHKRLVHEKVQLPKDKICDACGRGFATNRVLTQHMRTHTGERPFACNRCPARFRQLYSAQTHMRSQHADK